MDEQIEAEVTGGPVPVVVPADERWDVWLVDGHGTWFCWRPRQNAGQAAHDVAELQAKGKHTRIVHYALPALTIQAKENTDGEGQG